MRLQIGKCPGVSIRVLDGCRVQGWSQCLGPSFGEANNSFETQTIRCSLRSHRQTRRRLRRAKTNPSRFPFLSPSLPRHKNSTSLPTKHQENLICIVPLSHLDQLEQHFRVRQINCDIALLALYTLLRRFPRVSHHWFNIHSLFYKCVLSLAT